MATSMIFMSLEEYARDGFPGSKCRFAAPFGTEASRNVIWLIAKCFGFPMTCRNFSRPKKLRPALGGELAAREPVWDGEGWGCDRVA